MEIGAVGLKTGVVGGKQVWLGFGVVLHDHQQILFVDVMCFLRNMGWRGGPAGVMIYFLHVLHTPFSFFYLLLT